MRVHIRDKRNALKFQTIFEAFFSALTWTDETPDFVVDFQTLTHGERVLHLTKGRELAEIYRYLESLTPSRSEWGTLLGVRPLKLVHRMLDAGKSEATIQEHLLENILLQPVKTELLLEIAREQRAYYLKDREKLALFVSVPFCPSICSYCNFHTKPYDKKLAQRYLDALMESLDDLGEYLQGGEKVIDCIYLGGGTPTALEYDQLKTLLDKIDQIIPRTQVIEYTIEAGRLDSFTAEKMLLLERADRVCVNPQTLDPDILKGVNRLDGDFSRAIRYFEDKGIIVNSDLIAGLPGEEVQGFVNSLQGLLTMGPSNITIHNLSQKRGSALREQTLREDGVRQMLHSAYHLLKEQNYKPYYIYRQKNMLAKGENIGYAKDGTPCIYNIRMMEDAHEIISVGSNAVSKIIEGGVLRRIQTIKETTLYIKDEERRKKDVHDFFERG